MDKDRTESWRSRLAWQTLEPYHAMIYFAPEARTHYKEIGLRGFWTGYFASRAAAMGMVSDTVVAATFYNFHPAMVARALENIWQITTPDQILTARLQAADEALQRLLGDVLLSPEIEEAAEITREAVTGCSLAGRPVFAGHLTLAWPVRPHLALWHAITLLREYRGDAHVAALLAENIDGCEAHLTLIGTGSVPREVLQPNRGWNDEEWESAIHRLQMRGLLDEHGMLTPQGQHTRQAIEERTDQLSLPAWQILGEENFARLITLMKPISTMIIDRGGIPMPNPMGVPRPE
jgi:hypothetical protein